MVNKERLSIMKEKIALLLVVLNVALASLAADYTFNWDNAFPDSGADKYFIDENGKTRVRISFLYTNITSSVSSPKQYCIEKMWVYPDIMASFKNKVNKTNIAYHTNQPADQPKHCRTRERK